MRLYLKVLFFTGLLFFVSCDNSVSPPPETNSEHEILPAIDVPWTGQQSLVCFGTSLTYGYMPDDPISPKIPSDINFQQPPYVPKILSINKINSDTASYPALLAGSTVIKVYNEGYIGATTNYALEFAINSVFTKKPALVLLEFGANDFLQEIDSKVVESNLSKLIDTIRQFGSKVVLISFLCREMISNLPPDSYFASRKEDAEMYLKMLKRVAENNSVLFVENAMKGIYWKPDMMSDAIHPNAKGYRRMYENIFSALIKTFEANNMLK